MPSINELTNWWNSTAGPGSSGRLASLHASGRTLGTAVTLTTANTDVATAIPSGARGAIVTVYVGALRSKFRLAWRASATLFSPLSANDTLMGYYPDVPVQQLVPSSATHLHLACASANATAEITWLY